MKAALASVVGSAIFGGRNGKPDAFTCVASIMLTGPGKGGLATSAESFGGYADYSEIRKSSAFIRYDFQRQVSIF